MQLIERQQNQRGQLPLPAAALVIDMRGINDDEVGQTDEVIEWLKIEIADLASEMKSNQVHHWRFLTEFLSFIRIQPSREDEPPKEQQATAANGASEAQGLTGMVHPTKAEDSLFFEFQTASADSSNGSEMPFNMFEQNIDELVQEINRLRNNRIAAVKDLNRAAIPGRSSRDSTVRVIFLTDMDHPESLSSAACYAERLKAYYQKFERAGHQPMMSTTVFCLSNSGESGPPAALIKGLSRNNNWSHLDSLIISENFSEEAALIAGSYQAYLAELLLYVILIIPPLDAGAPGLDGQQANGQNSSTLGLPPQTYVVGLAALEYSARWGRRWLNFGLTRDIIDILCQKPVNSNKEKVRLADIAVGWFHDWRNRAHNSIPDQVPAPIAALEGIHHAREVGESTGEAVRPHRFNFHIGDIIIEDLRAYLTRLTQTYQGASNKASLQDAMMQSTPQIMQALREQESKSMAEREASGLGKLQVEAEQILGHPRFFTDASGSVPRARYLLEAVGAALAQFQQEHQKNPLNPLSARSHLAQRRDELEATGEKRINALQKHLQRWPFIASLRPFKIALQAISLILILLMSMAALFSGFAWLHRAIAVKFGSLLPIVDATWLGYPVLGIVAVILAVAILVLELILLISPIVNSRRSALYTELLFLITALVFVLFGLFISFSLSSLGNLPDDLLSIHYLIWLAFLPNLSLIVGLFALVFLLFEVIYFIWWLNYLQRERITIVNDLRAQHQQDIQDVTNYIADEVMLEMATRAELTDGRGGMGNYYYRISRFSALLDTIADMAVNQQKLATKRLLLSQDEPQQGANLFTGNSNNVWLDLHIRDEMLQIDELTDAYKSLKQKLVREGATLRNLAEFLLRSEGTEKAADIARIFSLREDAQDTDEHHLRLFLTMLVAIAARFVIDPLSTRNIEAINEQYQEGSGIQGNWEEIPALNVLVRQINSRISHSTLQALSEKNAGTVPAGFSSANSLLAANALATWTQLFWSHKNQQLEEVLALDGVLAHMARLLQEDYDPRAVMRRLLAHTSLFGRSLYTGQSMLYLLMAPSGYSHRFLQELKGLKLPTIVGFPDVERILLLGIKRFVAEPLSLPKAEEVTQPGDVSAA